MATTFEKRHKGVSSIMVSVPYLRLAQAMREPRPALVPDERVVLVSQIIRPWHLKESADVGIVGIPFDTAVSYRPGTRFGPSAVREALGLNTTYSIELDVDISDLKIVDCGDVDTVVDINETHRRVEAVLTPIIEHGITPVIIGGDHSLSYPCIKALCNCVKGEKVGIIDFDAHYDSRSATAGKEHSGLWVRQIQEIRGSPVKGENIVQIGIRGFAYSRFYRDDAEKRGMKIFTPLDVRREGIESIVEEALGRASDGTDAIYISIDIDCIDQAFAPGTSVPNPGGLMPWEVITGVNNAGKHPLTRAFDIVEIAPVLDFDNMTSRLGAEIIMNFLCGLASRKIKTL